MMRSAVCCHGPSSSSLQRSQPVPMAFCSAGGTTSGARLQRIVFSLAGGGSSIRRSNVTARREGTAPSGIKTVGRWVSSVMDNGTSTSADMRKPKIAVRPMTADDMVEVALCEEAGYPDLARVGWLEGAYGLDLVRLPAACGPAHIFLVRFGCFSSPLLPCTNLI